jgi:class 3 adenylate cyclase
VSIKDDLMEEIRRIFADKWTTRNGEIVPPVESLGLGNEAVILDGTVLYADLAGSTNMVDSKNPNFSSEIYKTYLRCAARIVRNEGGVITAYDGDRIMAVFIGDSKNTSAVRCGLKICGAVVEIINPLLKSHYTKSSYIVLHNVGIDTSRLQVSGIGIKGHNDLVWVGRAANYAAKLTELSSNFSIRITNDVFNKMARSVKYVGDEFIWNKVQWTSMNNIEIYRSNWYFYIR